VFNDWNHENAEVREHVKRNLAYLLNEYKFDGFRFDLTKGFTQRKCTESTASNYDQARIDVLTEYCRAIQEVKADAVIILEHFCCDAEERALAAEGMKVWRNLNNAYCQTAMGYVENSAFSSLWTGSSMPFGGYVGFMESHDEERTAYKAKTWGAGTVSTSLAERMQRAELNAAFFFTVPGPKMIWQFGELGYDYSIEENGRTGEKPLRWDYFEVPERRALYDTYASLIAFREAHPQFFTSEADFSWKVSTSHWNTGRYVQSIAGDEAFLVVGNFDTQAQKLNVAFPTEGTWRNYFAPSEEYVESSVALSFEPGEYRLFVNF
jgi:1,4-alpha-glucan branching enzyme